MLHTLLDSWYASDLPWQPIQPLSTMLERQPTLLVGEAAFIGLALVALVHAAANGRQHMLLWLAALVGGCCNDVFFMVLPFVDNFWHAQCTLMLTPRLPLYIPCAYIAFVYYSTVAVWRLRLSPLAQVGHDTRRPPDPNSSPHLASNRTTLFNRLSPTAPVHITHANICAKPNSTW